MIDSPTEVFLSPRALRAMRRGRSRNNSQTETSEQVQTQLHDSGPSEMSRNVSESVSKNPADRALYEVVNNAVCSSVDGLRSISAEDVKRKRGRPQKEITHEEAKRSKVPANTDSTEKMTVKEGDLCQF